MPSRKSNTTTAATASTDAGATSDSASQISPQTTEQQLKAQAEGGVSVEDYLLPRALTQRLAKSVLPPNTTIQKDALLAIQKAATVFVSYLSSHANEATLKRTVAPTDVFTALSGLEFDLFRDRLERELAVHMEAVEKKRNATREKKAAATVSASVSTPAKADAATAARRDEEEDGDEGVRGAKRVKRSGNGVTTAATASKDHRTHNGRETELGEEEEEQEEEEEEGGGESDEDEIPDEDDQDEDGDEEEEQEGEEEDGDNADEDSDRVEDIDGDHVHGGRTLRSDPGSDSGSDRDRSDYEDDEDGPGAQLLRENMGLG
ncbi:Histone-fold-containing protein [Elaphomyces granulatus]